MSVIQKGLDAVGVTMVADALPPKMRTVKVFQRLIAAMRAAEAEVNHRLSDSERQLNESLQENLRLHERVRLLEAENLQNRLTKGLSELEKITQADRKMLLALTTGQASSRPAAESVA